MSEQVLLSILERSSEFRDNFQKISEYLIMEGIVSQNVLNKFKSSSSKQRGNWYNKLQHFNPLMDLISFGGFGIVYKTKNDIDKRTYAVKIIPENEVKKEIKILSGLKHKNIVRYFHSWRGFAPRINSEPEDSKELVIYHPEYQNENISYIFLQMEYCEKTLEDWLFDRVYPPTEQDIVKQVIRGLNYLHKKHIVHGDLKTRNIFLKGKVVKIGDFGNTKKGKFEQDYKKDMNDLAAIVLEIMYPMKTYMERAKILTDFYNGIVTPDMKQYIIY